MSLKFINNGAPGDLGNAQTGGWTPGTPRNAQHNLMILNGSQDPPDPPEVYSTTLCHYVPSLGAFLWGGEPIRAPPRGGRRPKTILN